MDRSIREAALHLLVEVGWRGLSIERVAERAGVAVTTVYRRYSSVDRILLDLMERVYGDVPVPDTGSLRGDLLGLMEAVVAVWSPMDNPRRSLVAAIMAAMDEYPALAAAYRQQFADRRQLTSQIVRRAIDRGEVAADTDPDLLLDVLAGLVFYRVLALRIPLTPALATDVVDLVLRGALPTRPPAPAVEEEVPGR